MTGKPRVEEASRNTPTTEKEDTSTVSKDDLPSDLVLIGGGCQVRGEIRNCRRLEIEGQLEGDLETEEIVVRKGGSIKGKIKSKSAEIHGSLEGELSVDDLLAVRKTGTVSGDIDYGQLTVASGGQLIGSLNSKKSKPASTNDPQPKKRSATIEQEDGEETDDDQVPLSKIIDGLMSNGKK